MPTHPKFHKCTVCSYTSSHASLMKKHMFGCHPIDKDTYYSFICKECNYYTNRNDLYNRHLKTFIHLGKSQFISPPPTPTKIKSTPSAPPPSPDIPPFNVECPAFCDFSTSSKQILKEHLIYHHENYLMQNWCEDQDFFIEE